jgi:hypothetical protein
MILLYMKKREASNMVVCNQAHVCLADRPGMDCGHCFPHSYKGEVCNDVCRHLLLTKDVEVSGKCINLFQNLMIKAINSDKVPKNKC